MTHLLSPQRSLLVGWVGVWFGVAWRDVCECQIASMRRPNAHPTQCNRHIHEDRGDDRRLSPTLRAALGRPALERDQPRVTPIVRRPIVLAAGHLWGRFMRFGGRVCGAFTSDGPIWMPASCGPVQSNPSRRSIDQIREREAARAARARVRSSGPFDRSGGQPNRSACPPVHLPVRPIIGLYHNSSPGMDTHTHAPGCRQGQRRGGGRRGATSVPVVRLGLVGSGMPVYICVILQSIL
jgi:hypothetical protein